MLYGLLVVVRIFLCLKIMWFLNVCSLVLKLFRCLWIRLLCVSVCGLLLWLVNMV